MFIISIVGLISAVAIFAFGLALVLDPGGWTERVARRNRRILEKGRMRYKAAPVTVAQARAQGWPYLVGGTVFFVVWLIVLINRT